MKNSITLIGLLFSFGSFAQTFVQAGTTPESTQVSITYYENEGANRPSVDIEFKDEFKPFEYIIPACPGDFAWCLRNQNNDDVAYVKLDIQKGAMFVDVQLEETRMAELSVQEVYHIMLLRGVYTQVAK
jgi:hypothetical protein